MISSKIEPETRQRILNSFTPMGERLFTHSEQMFATGFSAWIPVFEYTFAGCGAENIEFHKRFLVEAAKEEISNGYLGGVVLGGVGSGYKSPLISDLRRERDKAGFGWEFFKDPRNERDHWKCWLSPCWKERERIRLQEPERRSQLLKLLKENLKLERAKETDQICRVKWSSTPNRTSERRSVAKSILGDSLGELGYRLRDDLSIPGWNVFSRPAAKEWELRFGIELQNLHVYTHIFACKNSLHKELLVWPSLYHPSEYVEVLLQDTAVDFGATYRYFKTDQELEINLRAILFLYQLEHDFILACILSNI
jgi:hypothetical protein